MKQNRMPRVRRGEAGHAQTLPGMVITLVGAVALGIGAANDTGWLAIAGAVVLGLGVCALSVLEHMTIDYDVYARLEKLEKK